jgi:hypothetical protein
LSLRRTLGSLASLTLVMCIASTAARAYSPEATAVVAERALAALPRSAQASLSGPELAMALAALADRAERDPETFELARQVAVVPADPGVSASEDPPTLDRARHEFDAAREGLRSAIRRADRMAAAEALVRLAQSAADLADPYRVPAGREEEPEGARAWFADGFEREALATVTAAPAAADSPAELSRLAGGARDAIALAVERGDDAAISRLRAELLSRASALVHAAAREAWRPAATLAPRFQLSPEPLRGTVTLSLEIPAATVARLDLYDVAGRRVRTQEFGRLPAGASMLTLPASWSAGLPSGVYLARLSAGEMRHERRVTRLAD